MNNLFETDIQVSYPKTLEISDNKKKLEILLKSDLDFKNENHNDFRHSWHAFPAKFPPKLARLFIEHLTEENDVVLDPMMGSSTTLLEADILNRKSLGFDIDPLSLIIGKSKFQRIDPYEANLLANKIISKAIKRIESNGNIELKLREQFDNETMEFIDYWFSKKVQIELFVLIKEIEKIKDENYRLFFMTIFSSIIITKSGGVTLALDLAHTRPHRSNKKRSRSVFVEFSKKIKKHLENRFHQYNNVMIDNSDAKNLPLDNNAVDLIITSPPYANNAIDYMRAHKFSLVWFGMSISYLRDIRKKFIGSDNISKENLRELPDYTSQIILKLKNQNEKKAKALQNYFSEMLMVIEESYRVLQKDRAFILVVATSILNGVNTQTHKCLAELGKVSGFELIGIGKRNLNRDRRMMPLTHNSNKNSIEARMHQEYVLGFWK